MTSLKTSIKTITYLSDTGCLEIQGASLFTPRRNNVSHGDTRLISQRIFWQIVFPATLFLILFQFAAFVGLLASRENLVGVMPFNLGTLINYQALLVGNLIGVPLCYFIIRVVRNPFYLRSYYSQLKQQVDAKVTKKSSRSGYWH